MNRFSVISSILGDVSERRCDSVDELLSSVSNYAGWSSRDEMHLAILKWVDRAKPGQMFKTRHSIIVVCPIDVPDAECPRCMSDNIAYDDLSPVEGGHIEQRSQCLQCNAQWIDEFTHSSRREFVSRGKLQVR